MKAERLNVAVAGCFAAAAQALRVAAAAPVLRVSRLEASRV
jgi:hypothetical protein